MVPVREFNGRKESVIIPALPQEGPVVAPGLASRIYAVVTTILSSIVEYIVPYKSPADDHRVYAAAVLANENGPCIGSERYVIAVRQEDDDAYTDILARSFIVPKLFGTLIPNQRVFEFRTPNISDTGDSIFPEIPHAPLINWFLSKKNIRQLQKSEADELELALSVFLKLQFLKDFTRRRFDDDKTYIVEGIVKDSQAIILALGKLNSDEAKVEWILVNLFGKKFVESRHHDLLAVLALMCQNSGITAHAMIEAHERRLNPKLDVVCLDLTRQQDHFQVQTEKDESVTFVYTFHAPYRFIDSEGIQQLKSAKLVFSVNLGAAEDGLSTPPKILYSYLVKDFISTSS